MSRYSMIGEDRVAAIGRWLSRHMASYAIATLRGMCLVECRAMTTEASLPKKFGRTGDRLMRVMAGSAPQPAIAFAGADAQCQLLDMTDNFDLAACRLGANICCQGIFEPLARHIIGGTLAGIGDTNLSRQMTLLANAISSGAGKLSRIDDGSRNRPSHVFAGSAMAASQEIPSAETVRSA